MSKFWFNIFERTKNGLKTDQRKKKKKVTRFNLVIKCKSKHGLRNEFKSAFGSNSRKHNAHIGSLNMRKVK